VLHRAKIIRTATIAHGPRDRFALQRTIPRMTTSMYRRYADTAHGQVHVRETGDGPVLLLVHWTPFSGRMYEGVAALFAAAGYRVIAPDLLGYGRSDARPTDWSMAAWAVSLGEMLDALGVRGPVSVLGGHNGASVALELAIARPSQVTRLIVDGAPILTEELRAAFRALVAANPPGTPQAVIDRTVGLLSEYIPGYRPEGDGLALLWPAMTDYLATDFVSSAAVAGAYDIAVRLPLATQPMMVLGAGNDTLAATFDQTVALARPAASHLFAGHHPIHFPERHRDYADVVLRFLDNGAK